MSKSERPDPKVVNQLKAMLPPETQRLLDDILSGAPADLVLAKLAQTTGHNATDLARLLQDPGQMEQLMQAVLSSGGPEAAQMAELLRQSGLLDDRKR